MQDAVSDLSSWMSASVHQSPTDCSSCCKEMFYWINLIPGIHIDVTQLNSFSDHSPSPPPPYPLLQAQKQHPLLVVACPTSLPVETAKTSKERLKEPTTKSQWCSASQQTPQVPHYLDLMASVGAKPNP